MGSISVGPRSVWYTFAMPSKIRFGQANTQPRQAHDRFVPQPNVGSSPKPALRFGNGDPASEANERFETYFKTTRDRQFSFADVMAKRAEEGFEHDKNLPPDGKRLIYEKYRVTIPLPKGVASIPLGLSVESNCWNEAENTKSPPMRGRLARSLKQLQQYIPSDLPYHERIAYPIGSLHTPGIGYSPCSVVPLLAGKALAYDKDSSGSYVDLLARHARFKQEHYNEAISYLLHMHSNELDATRVVYDEQAGFGFASLVSKPTAHPETLNEMVDDFVWKLLGQEQQYVYPFDKMSLDGDKRERFMGAVLTIINNVSNAMGNVNLQWKPKKIAEVLNRKGYPDIAERISDRYLNPE